VFYMALPKGVHLTE